MDIFDRMKRFKEQYEAKKQSVTEQEVAQESVQISNIRKRAKPTNRPETMTPEKLQELLNSGMTQKKIAEELGTTIHHVKRMIKENQLRRP